MYEVPDMPRVASVLGLPGFDFSKTYYISGPMAGYEELNFPAFVAAKMQLADSGVNVLSPTDLVPPNGNPSDLDYLKFDFEMMCKHTQGIILLKGWPKSRGARAELEIALTLEWPVYYYHNWILTDMNGEPK